MKTPPIKSVEEMIEEWRVFVSEVGTLNAESDDFWRSQLTQRDSAIIEALEGLKLEMPLHECGYEGYCEHYKTIDVKNTALTAAQNLIKGKID